MSKYLLFDIGGTKTRVAVSTDAKTFSDPVIFKTSQDYNDALNNLIETGKELSKEGYELIVGGVAGSLDKTKSDIVNSPNLPFWNGKKFKDDLQKAFSAKVLLENDTALVGLGEAAAGAGKGHGIVVYITVSTGVNGAKLVKGKLDESTYGFEIGRHIIDTETMSSWEELLDEESYHGEKQAEMIAIGVYNAILFWSPEIVVMGGGRMMSINIDEVRNHLQGIRKIFREVPPVVKAELGDVGGLYGALSYIRAH